MTAPLLVFGWGNASRGDDALGPLFVQQLSALAAAAMGTVTSEMRVYRMQPALVNLIWFEVAWGLRPRRAVSERHNVAADGLHHARPGSLG